MDKASTDIIIQNRGSSMVRSDPPENPSSENEAQTQTIQTLQGYQRNLPCGVSTETPCGVGNPQRLPCITLITLLRNNCSQPKLLPTSTGTNRQQRRIPSRTYHGAQEDGTSKEASIFGQMVRVPQ
jgi:hypothetical protein